MMRNSTLAACMLSIFVTAAGAQATDNTFQPKGLRPFIGLGLSTGGDTLMRVRNDAEGARSNDVTRIKAGDGLDLRLGMSFRLSDLPWSLQTAVAYHNDQSNGQDDTKYRFRRIPIEATLLWHATDRARIGFGVRKATNPTVKIDNGRPVGSNERISEKREMTSSTGFIVETEYAVTPGWSLKGRYVYETFRYKDFPEEGKIKGDHVAIQSVWYVN